VRLGVCDTLGVTDELALWVSDGLCERVGVDLCEGVCDSVEEGV